LEIWTDVLDIQGIGVDDPFQELGGHSLQALHILARLFARTSLRLYARDLLDARTIARLAALMAERQENSTPDWAALACFRPIDPAEVPVAPEAVELRSAPGLVGTPEITTTEVQSLYEQFPYPSPVAGESLIHDVANAVEFLFPGQDLADWNILDGGCGTGHRVSALAQAYPRARVLGIDLTPASLSVARQLASRHGLHNLEFQQANLLELQLARRFELIVSTGVIVCLPDPVLGLKNLLDSLAPQGVLFLWLYHALGEWERMLDRELIFTLWDNRADLSEGVALLDGLGMRLGTGRYGSGSAELSEGDTRQTSLDVDAYLHPIVHTYRFQESLELLRAAGAEWVAINGINVEGQSRLIALGDAGEDPSFCVLETDLFHDPLSREKYRRLDRLSKLKAIELRLRPTGFTLVAGKGTAYQTCGPRIYDNLLRL
jgi:SAM-dependent methyltransferase